MSSDSETETKKESEKRASSDDDDVQIIGETPKKRNKKQFESDFVLLSAGSECLESLPCQHNCILLNIKTGQICKALLDSTTIYVYFKKYLTEGEFDHMAPENDDFEVENIDAATKPLAKDEMIRFAHFVKKKRERAGNYSDVKSELKSTRQQIYEALAPLTTEWGADSVSSNSDSSGNTSSSDEEETEEEMNSASKPKLKPKKTVPQPIAMTDA